MIRTGLLCAVAGLLFVSVGCQKVDEEPQRAVVAKDKLMPCARPGFEAAYVADQRQVKLVERTVSYEPLETFRSRAAAEVKKEAKTTTPKKSRKAKEGKAKPKKKRGLLGRFKTALADRVQATPGLGSLASGRGPPPEMEDVGTDDDDEDMDDEDDLGPEDDEDEDLDEDDDDLDDEDDPDAEDDEDEDLDEDDDDLDDEDDPGAEDDDELDDEDDLDEDDLDDEDDEENDEDS